MNIKLNGGLFLNNDEYFFDNLEIDIEFDIDECDIENYIESCEDCGFCDCEDDEEDDVNQFLAELIDDYTEILLELGDCPDCIQDILIDFLKEILD